jgi:hypothetical protein
LVAPGEDHFNVSAKMVQSSEFNVFSNIQITEQHRLAGVNRKNQEESRQYPQALMPQYQRDRVSWMLCFHWRSLRECRQM